MSGATFGACHRCHARRWLTPIYDEDDRFAELLCGACLEVDVAGADLTPLGNAPTL